VAFKRQIIDLRSGSRPAPAPTSNTKPAAAASASDDAKRSSGTKRRRRRPAKDADGETPNNTPRKRRRGGRGGRGGRDERSARPARQERPRSEGAEQKAARAPRVKSNADAPRAEGGITFADLDLLPELQQAVADIGYTHPTPIQGKAIPALLDGRDVLGIAQTGTGKTCAFTLPVLQHLASVRAKRTAGSPRALVLTPTRELAIQIGDSFTTYGRHLKLSHTVIFGGVNQNPQVRAMQRGVDTLVATPGRLLDLIGQGFIKLDRVEFFVLDEADRMLDMGFIHDMRKVLDLLPHKDDRHTLLFSATMPDSIVKLARNMMTDFVRVEVTPASTTVERIDQSLMFVDKADKKELLAEVFSDPDVSRALVFSRTKHGANRIVEFLDSIGVDSAAIHGNKSQNARQRALGAFQDGVIRALVATDIAARGIDVDQVSHVINFDLPNEPESYVHRIGRTARAGHDGVAISFCMRDELDYLRDIEKLTRQAIPVVEDQPYHAEQIRRDYRAGKRGSVKQGGRGGGRGRGRGGRGGGGGGGRGRGRGRGGRPSARG